MARLYLRQYFLLLLVGGCKGSCRAAAAPQAGWGMCQESTLLLLAALGVQLLSDSAVLPAQQVTLLISKVLCFKAQVPVLCLSAESPF